MNIYLQQLLVALIAIYIVGVSGFTDSWRALLERTLRRWSGNPAYDLRRLPPFDCEKCATFWACLIYTAAKGEFSLPTLAAACGWSYLSFPIRQFMIFLRNKLLRWIRLD